MQCECGGHYYPVCNNCESQRWISIEKELPKIKEDEISDDVLVIDDDKNMYVAYLKFYPVTNYRKKEEYFWHERSTGCGCCSCDIEVTHWMPLPRLPDKS